MSSDVVVGGVRAFVGLSMRLLVTVDDAAVRVEGVQDRARELLRLRLPAPRRAEEL